MPPLPPWTQARARIAETQRKAAVLEEEAARLGAALRTARDALDAARRDDDAGAAAAAGGEAASLAEQAARLDGEIRAVRRLVDSQRAKLLAATPSGAGYELLDPRIPVLLLPVRLETRYVYVDAAGTVSAAPPLDFVEVRLWIRIYPDAIHETGHEPGLSAEELAWAGAFRDATAAAGGDRGALVAAWSRLVAQAGTSRAAWIASLADAPLPAEPGRGGAWTQAPRALCLPDRWLAVADVMGTRRAASSRLVRDPLFTGLDPTAETTPSGPDVLDLDDGVRWKVDFAEAVDAGMGIELSLGPAAARIDRLVVLGVRATLDATDSAAHLATLLDGHHYTDGLAFVPQGTPTNSTDRARSGYSTAPRDAADSYATERSTPLCAPGDRTDGGAAARALGLPTPTFAHVAGADATEQRDAADLQTALFPATWGFFLRQMMRPLAPPEVIAALRAHSIAHVRARGPLPALRTGAQVYGILPVSPPGEGGRGDFEGRLAALLGRLRPVWEAALPDVPRVATSHDPDRTMLDILRSDAVPSDLAARPLMGPAIAKLLVEAQDGIRGGRWLEDRAGDVEALLRGLGITGRPAIAEGVFLPFAAPISAPAVATVDAASGDADDPATYLGWLRKVDLLDQLAERYPKGGRPTSLLFAVLRTSILQAADAVALEMIGARGRPVDGVEPEVLGVSRGRAQTIARRLRLPDGAGTIASRIDGLRRYRTPAERELGEIRGALDRLARRPAAVLELVLQEALALASYRLDAWITSLATQRLAELRNASPTGIQLGGYGVVENLRPGAGLRPEANPPAGEDGEPLYLDAGNAGYVHAPSLAHAATAAVLRSGHLSHAAGGGGDVLSIDLSSDRVRDALHLLEGVRQGQPLGALLGYRIERRLHEAGLDVFVAPLRAHAPLTAGKLTQSADPVEAIAANTVVDGLRLVRAASRSADLPWGTAPLLPQPDVQQAAGIDAALADAAGALDALADTITAEAAFQAVRGNPVRLGATVDSLSGADVPPAAPEVTRSARSGIATTHRLMLASTGDAPTTTGWERIPETPRTRVEPHLAAWAATVLPAPGSIRVRARAGDWSVQASLQDLLSGADDELAIGPLDLVACAVSSDGAERSEIELRLAAALEPLRPAGTPGDLRLVFEPDPAWGPAIFALPHALEVARRLGELIAAARPMEPGDLAPPGSGAAPVVLRLSDLAGRADDAEVALRDARDQLIQSTGGGNLDDVRRALFRVAQLGVQGAPPASVRDEPDAARQGAIVASLGRQAASVVAELDRRVATLDGLATALTAAGDDGERRRVHRQRVETVFGRGFTILDTYTAVDVTELAAAYGASESTQGGDRTAARTWLQRVSRVRDGARRAERVLSHADLVATTTADGSVADPRPLAVVQLPYSPGQRWVALDLAGGTQIPGGRMSLVVAARETLDLAEPIAGLVVDEWTEVVPSRSETTAMSFHATAPSSVAPQALVLAVPPRSAEEWSEELVERIVLETLSLARIRAVDPDILGQLGQLVPALVLPDNAVPGEAAGPAFEHLAKDLP